MEGLRRAFTKTPAAWLFSFVALVVFAPAALPVARAVRLGAYTTLGRDQGIFQYIAWAISQGDRDYGAIRDVNGPVIHLVHLVFLALGGRDEFRFHVLDFTVSILTFLALGAALPDLRTSDGGTVLPRDNSSGHWETWTRRIFWGAVTTVVLLGQYVDYIFWDLAQRESICDWFIFGSIACVLMAQGRKTSVNVVRRWGLFAGVLGSLACLGKPTYALFVAVQLFGMVLGTHRGARWKLLLHFGFGLGVGVLAVLGFLLWRGDVASFVAIYFRDAPNVYRFIWHRPMHEIFEVPWCSYQHIQAAVTSLVLVGLMAVRILPLRFLTIALFPTVAFVGIVLQAKGFPYHFHPVSAGLRVAWLAALVGLSEALEEGARVRRFLLAGVFSVGSLVLSVYVSRRAQGSPYAGAEWLSQLGQREVRETRAFLDRFRMRDFFPAEMREAARFLGAKTKPQERVQLYGMDPYLLFLAKRRSASPYIYGYDLNYDFAIWGAEELLAPAEARERVLSISTMREAHETDLLARIEQDPPGAFVFIDFAPLLSEEDATADFEKHNARAMAWVRRRYSLHSSFGSIHVWLKKDVVL